ncbi:MAG: Mbeg1-like protein [Erysipelotrichaceae bacterium]
MNMIDYLTWRGDLSFETAPFNDVDNLLCSYLSYCDLSEVVKSNGETITISEACRKYFETHTIEKLKGELVFISMAPMVFQKMAQTERYKNAKLSYCVKDISSEDDIQFYAIRIDMAKNLTYLSFCGTNDTIVGWKEDFQLCYKQANAQLKAVEYIKTASNKTKKFYVGGHSKGGNLALYGAMYSDKKVQDRIIRIYNNDGPGLSETLYNEQLYAKIKDKCYRIVPQFSFFGQIFRQDCQQLVIKSSQKALMQHDATSWQVEATHFVKEAELDSYADVLNQAFNLFFEGVDNQQREMLTNELFDAIDQAGIKTLSEITKDGLPVVLKLIKSLSTIDEQAKDIISKLLKTVVDASGAHLIAEVEKIKIVDEAMDALEKLRNRKKKA